ncbi:MAG: nucleotide exchange factor GrpE [Spirochaetaceae bacterium]|jgi:molecular chaperone GrpE|nr:nucleotide exchange factor GrpE [Spirochaetaceae bacterium]
MSKHKKEETTITENTVKDAEEGAENTRDPGTIPEQAEQSPETGGGQPSEKAADAGTTAENRDAPQTEAGEAQPPSAEDRIAGLEAKLAEANDQYLRKAADFENYRKRMNQEKQSAIDYANQTLFLDLILVIDDFERAIKSAESQREAAGGDGEQIAAGYNSLYEGITMIEKNLVSQLENKWGLKRFDSAGEPFDPNRHEAIMMEKSADTDEPVVAEDFIKGYILKDRVIRPAKVKVVMPENK